MGKPDNKIYKIGRVYKICCPHTDKIYIGSTVQTIEKRFTEHKSQFKCGTIKEYSKFILELGDCWIDEIRQYENVTKTQLDKYEGETMKENIDLIVNKYMAGQTQKEYSIINKEKISKTKKEYYHDNIDKISKKNKVYAQENKEKLTEYNKEYRAENKEKLREQKKVYLAENKEKIGEQKKAYYERNKEKIRDSKSEIVICPNCGLNSTKSHLSRHQKSKKCLDN
jgi:ribosomal protein S27AE